MFVFEDILKPTIWGGTKICQFKGLDLLVESVGESWEISAVEGFESVVADGSDKGLTINQLVEKYGENLLGRTVVERFGKNFPILVKFIDANENLSIQVHPNDEEAMARHGANGKTEMWYVMDSDPKAAVMVGFKHDMTKEDFVNSVENSTIVEKLQTYNVKKGDVFFLPPGRIHSICSGTLIAEIQQSSDITYRIFDYDRVGKDGKKRQLHTDLALEVIDYKAKDNYKITYSRDCMGNVNLVKCKYFTTNLLKLNKTVKMDYRNVDSFIIYMCMEGILEINDTVSGEKRCLAKGNTILFPASVEHMIIKPLETSEILEVMVE